MMDVDRAVRYVGSSGLVVPRDLRTGGYPWKAYVYANLNRGVSIPLEAKAVLVDLFKTLLDVHKMPWVRQRLVPLNPYRVRDILQVLFDTVIETDSADVFRACLWQRDVLLRLDGTAHTDDHVLELVPSIELYSKKGGGSLCVNTGATDVPAVHVCTR